MFPQSSSVALRRVAPAGEPQDTGQGQEPLRQATASPRQLGRTIGESFLNPQIAQ